MKNRIASVFLVAFFSILAMQAVGQTKTVGVFTINESGNIELTNQTKQDSYSIDISAMGQEEIKSLNQLNEHSFIKIEIKGNTATLHLKEGIVADATLNIDQWNQILKALK